MENHHKSPKMLPSASSESSLQASLPQLRCHAQAQEVLLRYQRGQILWRRQIWSTNNHRDGFLMFGGRIWLKKVGWIWLNTHRDGFSRSFSGNSESQSRLMVNLANLGNLRLGCQKTVNHDGFCKRNPCNQAIVQLLLSSWHIAPEGTFTPGNLTVCYGISPLLTNQRTK